MDLSNGAERWIIGSPRHGKALFVAFVAMIALASAASAHAAPNGASGWGNNSKGQLGDGMTAGPEKCGALQEACSTSPVPVTGLSGVTAVSGGRQHSLALLENGTVSAWGANIRGQLGDGTTGSRDVPVAVCATGETAPCAKDLGEVRAIAAGSAHSLALLGNGTVVAWGSNEFGQLGDGTHENSDVPVAVSGLTGVAAISAGGGHSLALLSNGTVMAWGEGGQLGNGTENASDVPVTVSGLSGVVAISAGEHHSLALLSNGTVMAWGEGRQGELGNGGTTGSNVPVAVTRLTKVTAIAGGGQHSLALLSNGTVMSWGADGSGQLGVGTSTGPESCGEPPGAPCSKTPVAVTGLSSVIRISAGREHSLALLSGGSVFAWGSNESGQLGDGTSTGPEPCGTEPCSTKPVAVGTHGSETGIAAGGQFSLAFGPPPPPPTPLPEIGRCVPVKKGTGEYKGSICNHLSPTHQGADNWLPGPGATPKFAIEANDVILETVGKRKVGCAPSTIEGEWTGAKTATITLITLRGCVSRELRKSCQTTPEQQSQITNEEPLQGELGFIKSGEKPSVGLDIKAKAGNKSSTLVRFGCGGLPEEPGQGEQWVVEGSVIGSINPLNSMKLELKAIYTATAGNQIPERFEGGLRDTPLVKRLTTIPPPEEPAGLTLKGNEHPPVPVENEEPLEIKSVTYPS